MLKAKVIYGILDEFYDEYEEKKKSDFEITKLENEVSSILQNLNGENKNALENLLFDLEYLYQNLAFALGFKSGIETLKGIESPKIVGQFLNKNYE
ncbi:MAG: hypothetical protein ACTTIO_06480 [Candidatus Fimenecus sp.]